MLAANLHDYLQIHGALYVPDFGKFSWVKSVSKMLSSSGSFALGKAEVKFEQGLENAENWSQFLKFSAWKWNLPLEEISSQYNIELESWKDQFSENSELAISGIGSLRKNALKSIILIPEIPQHKGFGELPSIELLPIQRTVIHEKSAIEELDDADTVIVKGGIKYGRELLFGFLLFLLFCFIYLWFIQPNWTKTAEKRNLADFAHIDESRLNQDPVEFANGHAFDSAQDLIPENQNSNIIVEDTTDESISIPEDITIVEGDSNEFCIIIVGSFLNINRANKMEARLHNENRTVHTEFYGDYKRIGYSVNCDSLTPALQNARFEIDSKSWILQ